jgi:serine/threonine-protein kinase RsbW
MNLSDPSSGEADTPESDGRQISALRDAPPLLVEANPMGVRAALLEMRARFGASVAAPGTLGMAETVLAEVLNNIVEHAYPSEERGRIELRMMRHENRLRVDVRDYGAPMPGDTLPPGALPAEDPAIDDPPEGGFGWFLIRAFARDLEYQRVDSTNRLTFSVPLSEGA